MPAEIAAAINATTGTGETVIFATYQRQRGTGRRNSPAKGIWGGIARFSGITRILVRRYRHRPGHHPAGATLA